MDSAARVPMTSGAILTSEERTYDLTVEGEAIPGETPEADAARVGMLVRRVVLQADAREQRHLPGADERLDTFCEELTQEGVHDR